MLRFMFRTSLIVIVASAGCSDPAAPTSTLGLPGALSSKGGTNGPSDPTATWKFPLADASLSLKSDHRYGDGTYSVYADGVCGVAAKIFATTQFSNSGSASLQTSAPTAAKCGRVFTMTYPDGFSETLPSFADVNKLANTTYSIPVGTTVRQRFVFAPSQIVNNPSRCGKIIFGPLNTTDAAVGSDSVLVTRVDSSTWQIQSQAAPNDSAYCLNTGGFYHLQLSFLIRSSYPLP